MSYVYSSLGACCTSCSKGGPCAPALGEFDSEQRNALAVTPAELAQLSPYERAALQIQHDEFVSNKKSVVWDALAVAVPLLTFLGVSSLWGRK